jgi:predicted transcriptional regulator
MKKNIVEYFTSVINKSINIAIGTMYKYIVGKKQRHLIVSDQVHLAIKDYAKEKNLTMVEATYELLRIAFAKVYNIELNDK